MGRAKILALFFLLLAIHVAGLRWVFLTDPLKGPFLKVCIVTVFWGGVFTFGLWHRLRWVRSILVETMVVLSVLTVFFTPIAFRYWLIPLKKEVAIWLIVYGLALAFSARILSHSKSIKQVLLPKECKPERRRPGIRVIDQVALLRRRI